MEITEKTNELTKVIDASGVEPQTANTLMEKFIPFFNQAEEWKMKANALVVTDVNQTSEMKMARVARLALKEIRVNADKTRKELKEDSLRYGKAVQGVYNVIEYLISPIEKHLQEQENFAAIQEARRKAELKATREMELEPYSEFIPFGLDFGNMSEDDFQKTLKGAKLQLQAQLEAEKKAEEERIAKEKAEADERERLRVENERLKAEAKAKEDAMRKEREKQEKILAEERAKAEAEAKRREEELRKERAEAQRIQAEAKAKAEAEAKAHQAALRKEREEREKIEAEIRAKEEADARIKKEEEQRLAAELKAKRLADKKAKAAPEKAKIKEFSKLIDAIEYPELKSEEGKKVIADAKGLLMKVSKYLIEKADQL